MGRVRRAKKQSGGPSEAETQYGSQNPIHDEPLELATFYTGPRSYHSEWSFRPNTASLYSGSEESQDGEDYVPEPRKTLFGESVKSCLIITLLLSPFVTGFTLIHVIPLLLESDLSCSQLVPREGLFPFGSKSNITNSSLISISLNQYNVQFYSSQVHLKQKDRQIYEIFRKDSEVLTEYAIEDVECAVNSFGLSLCVEPVGPFGKTSFEFQINKPGSFGHPITGKISVESRFFVYRKIEASFQVGNHHFRFLADTGNIPYLSRANYGFGDNNNLTWFGAFSRTTGIICSPEIMDTEKSQLSMASMLMPLQNEGGINDLDADEARVLLQYILLDDAVVARIHMLTLALMHFYRIPFSIVALMLSIVFFMCSAAVSFSFFMRRSRFRQQLVAEDNNFQL